MGYDLHITRRTNWSDGGEPAISESEWQRVVSGDADAGMFYWQDGEVSVKNPEPALIAKMVRFAGSLSAQVQGDDGEIYREDGSSFQPSVDSIATTQPNIFRRIAAAWRRRRRLHAPQLSVGQRVRDAWGGSGTVIDVDPKANGGLGSVRVRMDDGREHDRACVASGFEILR